MREWLAELDVHGLRPQIVVIRDRVPWADLDSAEQEEISAAMFAGKQLLNVMFSGCGLPITFLVEPGSGSWPSGPV
ncbi:hypothetical protein [Streptomyces sp. NPDC097610]|uniref:hypothetical protein n=1 Tax=Streptomyces sp. NPDC097610 TaxID=3157227 RepID=UPI003324474D